MCVFLTAPTTKDRGLLAVLSVSERRGSGVPCMGRSVNLASGKGESDAGGVNAIDNASAVTLDVHLQGYLH